MSTWSPGRVGDNFGAMAVRLYRQTPESALIEAGEAHRRALAARRPLLWVAVTHTVAAFAAVAALSHTLGDRDPAAQLMAAGAVGVAVAFWAVWAWSAVAPLPAAVVGLVTYLSLAAAGWSRLPSLPPPPTDASDAYRLGVAMGQALAVLVAALCVTVTLALLARSVVAASLARRAALVASGRIADTGGVRSALGLYALLLAIVVAPHALGITGTIDAMRLVACAAVAWAIASWRTVLPALADAGASWLAVGVLLGLGTFALSSLYLDGTAAAFGLPRSPGADPWVAAGYGWAGAAAATVLFPAVFEELAFRGVIVPCLGRVMTGGETVLVSGAMFSALHLNPTTVPFLFPMGVVLGVLRRRSG
jgi:membrane protease YdiL (CAAX protease family)